jgi:hypothetical protein
MHQSTMAALLGQLYEGNFRENGFMPLFKGLAQVMGAHVVTINGYDSSHWCGRIDAYIGISSEIANTFEKLSGEHPWYLRGGPKLIAMGWPMTKA